MAINMASIVVRNIPHIVLAKADKIT
jgi:hypothetical protein